MDGAGETKNPQIARPERTSDLVGVYKGSASVWSTPGSLIHGWAEADTKTIVAEARVVQLRATRTVPSKRKRNR